MIGNRQHDWKPSHRPVADAILAARQKERTAWKVYDTAIDAWLEGQTVDKFEMEQAQAEWEQAGAELTEAYRKQEAEYRLVGGVPPPPPALALDQPGRAETGAGREQPTANRTRKDN